MFNDLSQLIISYYNLDMNTQTAQKEHNKLMNFYSHNVNEYRNLLATHQSLVA